MFLVGKAVKVWPGQLCPAGTRTTGSSCPANFLSLAVGVAPRAVTQFCAVTCQHHLDEYFRCEVRFWTPISIISRPHLEHISFAGSQAYGPLCCSAAFAARPPALLKPFILQVLIRFMHAGARPLLNRKKLHRSRAKGVRPLISRCIVL
jgi:hypothetical protein